MSVYRPDSWAVVKIDIPGQPLLYKVLGGWSGGYVDGNSWRLNSGIVSVEKDTFEYKVYGHSKSVYHCRMGGYGLATSTLGTYVTMEKLAGEKGGSVETLPDDTDWVNFDWTEART